MKVDEDNERIFTEKLTVMVPHGMRSALRAALRAELRTSSSYVREAIISRLENDGVRLGQEEHVAA